MKACLSMPIIKQEKSLGKFHMTTNDHYKKSNFVLVKPLVLFYGQVNKTSEPASSNIF